MDDPGIVAASVVVQLTDLHLGPPGSRPYGIDTAEQVRRVARTIRDMALDPVALLLTGDLSDAGDAASYEVLLDLMARELSPIGAPILPVVGNHDHRGTFRRVVLGEPGGDDDRPHHYVVDADGTPGVTPEGVRIVMCDSYVPGAVTGRLGRTQLDWLDSTLASARGRTCVVALHHPAVPRGVPRRRDYLLEDRDEFAEVLAAHRVAVVLCGHSHVATTSVFAGTLHVAAPATAYLLDPASRGVNRSYPGAGFAVCTLREGRAVVNPHLLEDG